jgi:putative adhesin
MIGTVAAFALAVLASGMQTDTTVAVRPGERLVVSNFSGDIAVQTWTRSAIRVEADHSHRTTIAIERAEPTIQLNVNHWHGVPSRVDYQLTVPKWMALELSVVNGDIDVQGSESEVKAESVQGDVTVTGPTKLVVASSIQGDVRVTGARGKVECSSVNSGLHVEKVSGPVGASSVNGEVSLTDIESDDVEASTISGSVSYDGTITDGGSYKFSTTNGDVSVAVPTRANATVSVSTFSGEFESEFPVTFTGTRHKKQFSFMLGSGSARVDLESFQGGIQLRRPGSPASSVKYDYKYEYKTDKKEQEKTTTKKSKDNGDEQDHE